MSILSIETGKGISLKQLCTIETITFLKRLGIPFNLSYIINGNTYDFHIKKILFIQSTGFYTKGNLSGYTTPIVETTVESEIFNKHSSKLILK